MSIHIERDPRPSKLDERLEVFKDRETGEVLLTKNQATHILTESLLGFYRSYVSSPNPKIEALIQIVKSALPEDMFNFTEILEDQEKVQTQRDVKRREIESKPNYIIPAESPQTEI